MRFGWPGPPGYRAPRGAAYEHRIAALVCDPGQFEFVSRIKKMLVPSVSSDGETAWAKVAAADLQADETLPHSAGRTYERDLLQPSPTISTGFSSIGDLRVPSVPAVFATGDAAGRSSFLDGSC
jgi:hypothetical protein